MKTHKYWKFNNEGVYSEDSENGRRYIIGDTGISYPSITTVLSAHNAAFIEKWKNNVGENVANKIKNQASARGTKFHNFAENYLLNNTTEVDNDVTFLEHEMFTQAIPYLDRIDNIRALETPLYSKHLRIAGRLDCIAEYEGKLSIIDFKTASKEKQESYIQNYYMQASGYAIMCEEISIGNHPISNLVIIITNEEGSVQVFKSKRDKHVKDLLYYRDLFEKNNSV